MTSSRLVAACHSEQALLAEVAFWAASADCRFIQTENAREMAEYQDADVIILELSEQSVGDLDTLQQIAHAAKGKVIGVSSLDTKSISSIRRLLEAKGVNVILISRTDFDTRLLSDLLKVKPAPIELDRDRLASAIRDGFVIAHYQPKVPLQPDSGNFGVEALCRIDLPGVGLLFPDSFIPLAEAHDLILDLTDAVTTHAFRSMASWDAAGLKLRLAINISPRLMNDTVWFESFLARCYEYHVDPKRVTLEVTESSSQGGKVLALEILSRLRLKGFLLSIDDFGTGFSSLETLYKLPFGELKIDKGFVFDLQKNSEARALIESTIHLARKLGLKICAEGVESEEIFDELRDLQCDDAQGYFISKPLTSEKIIPFFNEWQVRTRRPKQNALAASNFSSIHALLEDLLSDDQSRDDDTIVLSSSQTPNDAFENDSRAIASKIPALLLSGSIVPALEQLHRAMRACSGDSDRQFRNKLEKIKTELEFKLASHSAVELHRGGRGIQLRGGRSFTIGRHSPSSIADIAIPCRWMSRGEKNLRAFAQGSAWYIEDLGSTNGHFVNGVRLTPFKALRLDLGKTIIEIGKTGNNAAPAWLWFRVCSDGAVHLSFGEDAQSSNSDSSQLCADWILFEWDFAVGGSADAALTIPECEDELIADISLRNSKIWIAPRSGKTVSVGNSEFAQAVPVVVGTTLKVADASWDVGDLTAPNAPPSLAATA